MTYIHWYALWINVSIQKNSGHIICQFSFVTKKFTDVWEYFWMLQWMFSSSIFTTLDHGRQGSFVCPKTTLQCGVFEFWFRVHLIRNFWSFIFKKFSTTSNIGDSRNKLNCKLEIEVFHLLSMGSIWVPDRPPACDDIYFFSFSSSKFNVCDCTVWESWTYDVFKFPESNMMNARSKAYFISYLRLNMSVWIELIMCHLNKFSNLWKEHICMIFVVNK